MIVFQLNLDPVVFQQRMPEALAKHQETMDKLLSMLTDKIEREENQKGLNITQQMWSQSHHYDPLLVWPSDIDRAENDMLNEVCEKLEEAEEYIQQLQQLRAA